MHHKNPTMIVADANPGVSAETHRQFVERSVATQLQIYRLQPKELVSHFNREESVTNSYRGRQVLELLQNADDAGANYGGKSRILLRLTKEYLAVANTGEPFSRAGFESLFISDNSPKQLHRAQCIGNKGLGFRSVLSWTSMPLILSGENAIAFSAEVAIARALELAEELPELRDKFDEWTESEGRLPVPTMRFPFIPNAENSSRRICEKIQQRGYDTVVLLPLLARKHQEVVAQFRELSGETALFCRHLRQLTIETPEINETWDVERDPETDGIQPTIITHRGQPRLWTVHRETGSVRKEALDERLHQTPGYEVALAVPEQVEPGANHKLCVFFPTDDSIPMPMLAHSTLDTDDNRKRLTNHAANREVLKHLAELIAEVAEREAARSTPARVFELLSGIERCAEELKEFGFLDAVLGACRQKKIFSRLDGQLTVVNGVRVASKPIWRRLANADVFPEMFAIQPSSTTDAFIAALSIEIYTEEQLSRGLEALANRMTPAAAGAMIGPLLADDAVPSTPLPSVLRDETGAPIPAARTTFLPPENQPISLPAWAGAQISVLHSDFAHALRVALKVSTVRDLRLNLRHAGYDVEEFRFETLARRLEEIAAEDTEISIEAKRARCQDVLRCLFDLARADKDLGVIKAAVRVVTTNGSLRRADDCYFGPDYEGHQLAYDLYRPFAQDEFVSSAIDLGLADKPLSQVVDFLKRLGVLDQPRYLTIGAHELSRNKLDGLKEAALADAADLRAAFGIGIQTPADVHRHFCGIKIDGIKLPDRFIDLLRQQEMEPLISFLAGPGAVLFMSEYALDAEFKAKPGPRYQHRSYPIRIPNPVTLILRREEWVPCADGRRRRPSQIILHRLGSMILEGTFFTHAIYSRSSIELRAKADSVLLRLGAIHSLEALRPDDMYRLLGDLPARDPKGIHAPSIYRSLLEQGVHSEGTPERQAFVTSGKMWGHLNDQPSYYPIAKLRYSSRRSLPAPVRKLIPLVDIDARRKVAEVERIFGVQQLKTSDVVLTVDKAAIEACPWSCLASERFSQAIPFLYACRLARTADEDGREMRRLCGVSICVCTHVRASVTVEGVARDDVVFDRELEGVVAKATIFLVSHRSEFPRMNQSFWRAVGDLLAEIVDAAVGGDFASILACESPQDMRDLLDQISEGNGDALLAKAKTRLTVDLLTAATNEVLPLPPPPSAPAPATSAAAAANQDTEASIETEAPAGADTFQQTQAPVRRASEPIRFCRGAHTARGGKRMVQITDETETTRIAIRYEEQDGRFTIATSHIRGYDGPGCDLLSVRSQEVRNYALEMQSISLDDVERFIEVKGRNQRTGAVELTENELLGAEKYGSRYFIYRVFCDPTDPTSRELGILCDPMNSPVHKIYRTARFHFHDASGATWFALVPESALSDHQGQE